MSYQARREEELDKLRTHLPSIHKLIVTNEVYEDSTAINQSSINKILSEGFTSLDKYMTRDRSKDVKKDYYTLGTLFELLLTGNIEEVTEKYITAPALPKLTPLMDTYVHSLIRNGMEDGRRSYEELVMTDFDKSYVFTGFKQDDITKVISKTTSDIQLYITLCLQAAGKTIVPQEISDKATSFANIVASSKVFNDTFVVNTSDKIILFDVAIIIGDFKFKMDALVVNLVTKKIKIIDFKTTSKQLFKFRDSAYAYGYDVQRAFYLLCLNTCINDVEEFDMDDNSFGFLVVNHNLDVALFDSFTRQFMIEGLGKVEAGIELMGSYRNGTITNDTKFFNTVNYEL